MGEYDTTRLQQAIVAKLFKLGSMLGKWRTDERTTRKLSSMAESVCTVVVQELPAGISRVRDQVISKLIGLLGADRAGSLAKWLMRELYKSADPTPAKSNSTETRA